ncbi:MAG: hypothetical protein P8X43_04435 [Maritimibacter sp.]
MSPENPQDTPRRGTLLEAENGPAIEYDETGLVLHLADKVVEDLARRLGGKVSGAAAETVAETGDDAPVAVARGAQPDPGVLDDIDAWDLQENGNWYRFMARLPGAEGSRHYLRPRDGGGIIAEAGGAVQGLFGIGGGRHVTTWPSPPRFRHHVVMAKAPSEGEPERRVENLRETSGESALGDALIARRHDAYRALPLIVTGQDLLPPGPGEVPDEVLEGLSDRLTRFQALATSLGKSARLLALRVAPGPDQAAGSISDFHRAALAQLDAISAKVPVADLGKIRFLTVTDSGAWWQHEAEANRPALEGQYHLILRPGAHHLIVAAPGYMFAQDDLGQPTQAAALNRAEMEAYALEADLARESWTCPLLYLAERDGDVIRATFKSDGGLVLDPADPFGAGPAAGFALAGTEAGIASVEIASDDPGAVLIRTNGALTASAGADSLRLDYAIGGPARVQSAENFPPACGALRDHWQAPAPDGSTLHRWALPGSLELR